jgi:hypothetical protein
LDVQFPDDIAHVYFHGLLGNTKIMCNEFVWPSRCDQFKHLCFARGERASRHEITTPGTGLVPPHLDGIESATQAAIAGDISATGTAAIFANLAFHVDRLYPFATIAVAVRPATTIALDAEGRPHAEIGPALAWADGTHLSAWHGQLVSADLLDPDRPVTLSRIHDESEPVRRWVLIERLWSGTLLP